MDGEPNIHRTLAEMAAVLTWVLAQVPHEGKCKAFTEGGDGRALKTGMACSCGRGRAEKHLAAAKRYLTQR